MAIRGGFEIATAYIDLVLDKDSAKREARNLPRTMGGDLDRSGRDMGDFITRGIRLSIVRNSPLITAAILGGLAAGGPVVVAAATTLFAGIGAVAAAQSQKVQAAWQGLWAQIKTGAQADARVLVPTFVNMAAQIGASFERMRPTIRGAFSDVAPQVDVLTGSIVQFAETTVSALARMVSNAGPAITGFGQFIEATGQGVADMLDAISEHSAAAGTAWQELGGIVGTLLPLLGELVGTGAELATIVLPALGGVLNVVLGAARALSPILPGLVASFTGFRIAQAIAPAMQTFAVNMQYATTAMTGSVKAGVRVGGALSNIGRILPGIGIAVGLFGAAMQEMEERTTDWANALLKGGSAAAQAYQDMGNPGFWDRFLFNLTHWFNTEDVGERQIRETREEVDKYLASLTPLGRAQVKAAEAERNLQEAINGAGEDSLIAGRRRQEYAAAVAEVARQERIAQEATHGSAIAMQDAATAAENLTGALEAMNQPVLSLRDAQREYQQAIDDASEALAANGKTLDDNTQAGRDNSEALDKIAAAAMQTAEWVYKTTGSYDQFRASLEGARQQLYDQAIAFGKSKEEAAAYVDEVLGIPSEWRTVAEFDTSTAMGEVQGILAYLKQQEPNAKINVGVISEEAFNILAQLGLKVQALPDGTVAITLGANPSEDIDGVQHQLDVLDGTNANVSATYTSDIHDKVGTDLRDLFLLDELFPQVDVQYDSDIPTRTDADLGDLLGLDGFDPQVHTGYDSDVPEGSHRDFLDLLGLDRFLAQPSATMGDSNIPGKVQGLTAQLFGLDGINAQPTASLNDGPFTGLINRGFATIAKFAAQRPTPTAGLNDSPFMGIYAKIVSIMARIAASRPTPTVGLSDGPFQGVAARVISVLGRIAGTSVFPTATLIASTSGAEAALNYAARSRTSYVYQVAVPAAAGGGRVGDVVRGFAGGGSPGGWVRGPGGWYDDMIAAITSAGEPIRVSNEEFIVPGAPATSYGNEKMQAVRNGTAVILTPRELARMGGARGFLDGGFAGDIGVTRTPGGATISIGQLHVHIEGTFDFTRPGEMRRVAMRLREALIQIDREQR